MLDKPEIQAAIIAAVAALAGAIVGAIAAWMAASSTNKIQQQIAASNLSFQEKLAQDSARMMRKASIEAMVLKLSEFAMMYPTLEKDAFCQAYPDCPGDPNAKERYENYCVYVFNALAAAFEFVGHDGKKLSEFIGAEELIRRHWRCWQGDRDNLNHDDKFRQYVHATMDELRKKGEIK